MKKLIVSIIVMVMLLTGCAGFTAFLTAMENPILQRTVQYGVIKHLGQYPHHQPEALNVINRLQKAVDQSIEITVHDLETMAIEFIPWHKLSPEDQFFLLGMIADISYLIRQQVGDGILDSEEKIRVRSFLAWIEQAVRFVR